MSRLNDPRENRELTYGFLGFDQAPEGLTQDLADEIRRVIGDRIWRGTYVGCFTAEEEESPEDGHFTRGYSRARSWAQYGDHHRGACLVLGRRALIRCLNQVSGGRTAYHGRVLYEDKSATEDAAIWYGVKWEEYVRAGAKGVAERWLTEGWQALYFRKNTDWESETEYRLVLVGGNEAPELSIIDCISGVILGEAYPSHEENILGERLRRLGVEELQLGKMSWVNGVPGASFVLPPGFEPIPDEFAEFNVSVRPTPI